MPVRIGFTGHRDKLANPDDLIKIHEEYPNAIWVHGGSRYGFDAQVKFFAELYNHQQIIYYPEYKKYYWKVAPLVRNKLIVDNSNCLVALYDGRNDGGTKFTIDYAKEVGKEIKYLPCLP